MQQIRITVSGRVQGVGFRWSTKSEADLLGVKGYVRNLPDRTVEIVAQGHQAAVERLIAWSREGPPHSHVSNVEVTEQVAQSYYAEFTIQR
jgi:acylphosphatase